MTDWERKKYRSGVVYVGSNTIEGRVVPTGMHVGTSSSIESGNESQWEDDPKRPGVCRRINPAIRMVAFSAIPSWQHTIYHELFVAWNREVAPGERGYQKYLKDISYPNYIGNHKSISPVTTALKKWMTKN